MIDDPDTAAWTPVGVAAIGGIRLGVADLLDAMPCATYNRAQVRALVADVDGAIATLGRAVAEDPRCRSLAVVDPIFASLERMPSFRSLITAS